MDRTYLSNFPGSRAATHLGRGMTTALKACCDSRGETEKMGLAPCPYELPDEMLGILHETTGAVDSSGYGAFQKPRATPIYGWFLWWKILRIGMITRGTPIWGHLQSTPNDSSRMIHLWIISGVAPTSWVRKSWPHHGGAFFGRWTSTVLFSQLPPLFSGVLGAETGDSTSFFCQAEKTHWAVVTLNMESCPSGQLGIHKDTSSKTWRQHVVLAKQDVRREVCKAATIVDLIGVMNNLRRKVTRTPEIEHCTG